MRTIDQITYQAGVGDSKVIHQTAASFSDEERRERWRGRLDPWLRVGGRQGCAYLNFETEAAFIRWWAEPRRRHDWEFAHALVGPADVLTATYALELAGSFDVPALDSPDAQLTLTRSEHGAGRQAIESRARSADAVEQLAVLLAHALGGARSVFMPCLAAPAPDAIMWGLIAVLTMIGDPRPVSFFTYPAAPRRDLEISGFFVGFRPDYVPALPPDPGYLRLAETLTMMFADDPDGLSRLLSQQSPRGVADRASRIGRLLDLLPAVHGTSVRSEGSVTLNASFDSRGPVSFQEPAADPTVPGRHRHRHQAEPRAEQVRCPMCLHEIKDWAALDYWHWDPGIEEYVEHKIDPGLDELQLRRSLHGASVRCEESQRIGPHYLPADYGRFGPPIVLGFVGLTLSGKTHLLASIVGEIAKRELGKRNITASPLDLALHRRFLRERVEPLQQGRVLPGTSEGIVQIADAFLISPRRGPERVVALFDVAGGDLTKIREAKEFLWIADGLFFVVDANRMSAQSADDETFGNALDVVRNRPPNQAVSAAIVLNKADLVRFDEPVDRWLRSETVPRDGQLDPTEFLRESADVYAFLESRNALAMAEPYEVCDKATLHVVSPTGGPAGGGGFYPRGVTPRRALRPLIAMLAMTGVLTGADAKEIGV
jgi:hypothetical protein